MYTKASSKKWSNCNFATTLTSCKQPMFSYLIHFLTDDSKTSLVQRCPCVLMHFLMMIQTRDLRSADQCLFVVSTFTNANMVHVLVSLPYRLLRSAHIALVKLVDQLSHPCFLGPIQARVDKVVVNTIVSRGFHYCLGSSSSKTWQGASYFRLHY